MPPVYEPFVFIPAAVLAAVLLLLAIPVTVSFTVIRQEAFSGRITIGWLFGLLRYNPSLSYRLVERFLWVMKSKVVKQSLLIILVLLRDLVRCVRFVSLHVAGRFGLDNPHDTGRLWGIICALTGFLHGAERVRIHVEPDFNEAVFELDSRGVIRVVPIALLLHTARIIFSPSTLRAVRASSRRSG